MSPLLRIVVSGMGLGRIALGLAPFVAAGPSSRLLGFPASHDTATARLMGRFFVVKGFKPLTAAAAMRVAA